MATTKKETTPGRAESKNQKHHNRVKTQKQQVLSELKLHKSKGVTSWDLIEKYHITRASAYIWELRHKDGLQIAGKQEIGENGAHYTRYILEGK